MTAQNTSLLQGLPLNFPHCVRGQGRPKEKRQGSPRKKVEKMKAPEEDTDTLSLVPEALRQYLLSKSGADQLVQKRRLILTNPQVGILLILSLGLFINDDTHFWGSLY